MRVFARSLVVVVLALSGALSGAAPEPGAIPYAALYQALRPVLELRGYDRLLASATVQSKLPGVQAASIRLVIHRRGGPQPVNVAADGSFDFPLTGELLEENPMVTSNQPRGSLTLAVTLSLRPVSGLRISYGELAAGIDQARAALASDPARVGTGIRGVELRFPPGHMATVVLSGRSERLLMADAGGVVIINDSQEWRSSDTEVVFSEPPAKILPLLDQPGDLP
ncbi:MAG: hypothetical protein AB7V26_14165 [Lysobacterales bacterium]